MIKMTALQLFPDYWLFQPPAGRAMSGPDKILYCMWQKSQSAIDDSYATHNTFKFLMCARSHNKHKNHD